MRDTLLIELLTEELPPRSLRHLGEAMQAGVVAGLEREGFVERRAEAKSWATPRRLAVTVSGVLEQAPDQSLEFNGPSLKAGLDASGRPTPALLGFAKKRGVSVDKLIQGDTPKGKVFVSREQVPGGRLDERLAGIVAHALRHLPAPKLMRWGDRDEQFVRPVHGLVMLYGPRVVPGTVLGAAAGNTTRGHRFQGAERIALAHACEYEARLADEGKVIADFAARRSETERRLQAEAARRGAGLGHYQDLLDEVTGLVEWPAVYAGEFDAGFLEVPQECLILTMRQNQRYFPLFDAAGKLQPAFLIVSNMRVADPVHIVRGNERVVRPRLEDARFFYNQDRKTRLEARVPALGKVVYHNKLGSQLERVERMQLLAGRIARAIGADALLAERAAWLSKADLLTGMVGEFPELQGVMGRYYALHDREPPAVASAIEAHYRPRHAGDAIAADGLSCAVALADRLDALTGLFGVGEQPTGERDPFGLRRSALGVIRMLVESQLALPLDELLAWAQAGHAGRPGVADARADVAAFIIERLRGYCLEQGYTANETEAVLCQRPARLDLVPRQLQAVRSFSRLPEAQSLAAANKRIGNILRQAQSVPEQFEAGMLVQPEERALADAYGALLGDVEAAFRALDYTQALRRLAALKEPVDAFFDKVMVMDEDARLRANRIALLGRLHATMNRVADLSRLAA